MLFALACAPPPSSNAFDTADDGALECDRISGTTGAFLYEDAGEDLAYPKQAPSDTIRTTGAAGPLSEDGLTWMVMSGGRAAVSVDGGCSWDDAQGVPATGNWKLLAAGTRVYAFDLDSSAGARSDDLGASWTPFDAGEAFVALPSVDAADPDRLRGVQARGVVTTSDGGDTWPLSASLPEGVASVGGAYATPNDLDRMIVTTDLGIYTSTGGGAAWNPVAMEEWLTLGTAVVHPADPDVLLVQGTDADGVFINRTVDGVDWDTLMASGAYPGLADGAPIWPLPSDSKTFLTTTSTDGGVNLHMAVAGDRVARWGISGYLEIEQLAIGEDRWVAAVSAVP